MWRAVRPGRATTRLLLTFGAMFVSAAAVWTQQPPPMAPPAGFVPLDPNAQRELLPAAPLLMAAYAIAWVVLVGYLWSIWRRLAKVERELMDVSRRVAGGARR